MSLLRSLALYLLAVVFCTAPAWADHPELGRIAFPNSGSAEAQEDFIRAVL